MRGFYVKIIAAEINYIMRNDFDKFIFDLFMMTYRLLMFAVEKYFTTAFDSEEEGSHHVCLKIYI